MAFQFPASPTLGQLFTPIAGVTYQYDGAGWAPYLGSLAVAQSFMRRNRIRNGNFFSDYIANGAAVGLPSGSYGPDYWIGTQAGSGTYTKQRVADPDDATKFALKVAVTTAAGSIAAGDAYTIYQIIEGFDIADLLVGTAGAKKIAISFDMKFSVTGNYGVSIRNSAANRGYVGVVTQNVANATESKTVLLTLDTTGSWLNNGPGVGMYVGFCLAAGVNLQTGSPGAWFGANIIAPTTQVNFLSSLANVGYLKNFQLERGAVATVFDEGRSDGLVPTEEVQQRSQPFRNKLHNGDFRIDQIQEGAAYTIDGQGIMALDQWSGLVTGGGTMTMQRINDAVLGSYMRMTVVTPDVSLAAPDLYRVYCALEGYELQDLYPGIPASEYVTISFEMMSTIVGTFGVSISNGDVDRSYSAVVTQNIANVWEFKRVTFKMDMAGTWRINQQIGLYVSFTLAAGTTHHTATPNTWEAALKFTTAAQVNFMATAGNFVQLRNFQLERGIHATPFERVPFAVQLARCQRFYEKSFPIGVQVSQGIGQHSGALAFTAPKNGPGTVAASHRFATVKRVTPSMTFYNPINGGTNWYNVDQALNSGPSSAAFTGTAAFTAFNVMAATDLVDRVITLHWTANCRNS